MDLKAGDSAAVAGKLAKKRRHRHDADDPRSLRDAVISRMSIEDDEPSRKSPEDTSKELLERGLLRHGDTLALEEIRNAIATRNQNSCRPKFLVKPKPKKEMEEFKSLRLKTAVSAHPPPEVQWDRNGIVLETGNKFSIYNDGDFYYLEVHHVSIYDKGFYNCTATNSEGFATCTSEVDVIPTPDTAVEKLKKRTRRSMAAPVYMEVLPGRLKVARANAITEHHHSFQAAMGEEVSVECSVSGYPAPAISWTRNGCPLIPQPERCFMYYDGECATLKFVSVSMADAGTYACLAENGLGEATTQVCMG